jgi:hypothetical protein
MFLLRCAGDIPPSGGPVDTVPPKIIATYPDPNTVGFSGTRISLEFDKYVDERSVESSIFISPFVGSLEYDWSGKEVEIRFSEKLRGGTTYVVSVGTDVVDIRNKNRMDAAFTLAFSTGTSIDSGAISGRVYDDKPEGIMIFAYQLDSLDRTKLDPSSEEPHYATQTGKGGSFNFSHLRFGNYRLFAVQEEFKNLLYDIGTDRVGVYWRDISIDRTTPSYGGVIFQLTKEDTTRPQLTAATAFDKNHARLRFSKSIDVKRLAFKEISIIDTLGNTRLEVMDGFVDLQNPHVMVLVTSSQKPMIGYRVTVENVYDSLGHPIDPKFASAVFAGSEVPDTSAPKVIYVSVQDSARQIPRRGDLDVQFDDVVDKRSAEAGFSLLDSAGAAVSGDFQWLTSSYLKFSPSSELRSKEWYLLRLSLRDFVDLAGNRGRDTVIIRHFQSIDSALLGSIGGEVIDETGIKSDGKIFVRASDVRAKGKQTTVALSPGGGKFQIPNLTESSYVLSAFRDDDQNGRYTYGSPFPFSSSEIFSFFPDTLKVRARWPVEGVVIRLK